MISCSTSSNNNIVYYLIKQDTSLSNTNVSCVLNNFGLKCLKSLHGNYYVQVFSFNVASFPSQLLFSIKVWIVFQFSAKPSLPPGVLPMNTLYGMQQGLIHAYVSSQTFFLLFHIQYFLYCVHISANLPLLHSLFPLQPLPYGYEDLQRLPMVLLSSFLRFSLELGRDLTLAEKYIL